MAIKVKNESSKDKSRQENLKMTEYLKKDISEDYTKEIYNGKMCFLLVSFSEINVLISFGYKFAQMP